jgi:hypothetical protein
MFIMSKYYKFTTQVLKEVHNVKVLQVQGNHINKSDARCVRALLLLGVLLGHNVATLDARIPLLASTWRWCGLSHRWSIL